eukprot:15469476-Alexandrium_andersonii.AAC.1
MPEQHQPIALTSCIQDELWLSPLFAPSSLRRSGRSRSPPCSVLQMGLPMGVSRELVFGPREGYSYGRRGVRS